MVSNKITSLKRYFKGSSFSPILDNISETVRSQDLYRGHNFAMILTDNPQILLNVGVYPIGRSSCQSYEGDPMHNKVLTSYIGDSHIKVMFLIDLDKLPSDTISKISEQGFDSVKDSIHPLDLLNASVARKVIKLVRTSDKQPAIFLEPTYSKYEEIDFPVDNIFINFVKDNLGTPMGVYTFKGTKDTSKKTLIFKPSRGPEGQYEDGATGNANAAGEGIKIGEYTLYGKQV